jgi:sulfur relay protein TusB/DsrH
MLVIVKSGPETVEGRRGITLAKDTAADLALIQNGVYFAQAERLDGFCGTAYLLEEDSRLRGIRDDTIGKGIRRIDYEGLVDVMTGVDKVAGIL